MADIIKLRWDMKDTIDEFAEEVHNDEVSHLVVCYRRKEDGSLCYRYHNPDDVTFLIGMLHRIASEIHNKNATDKGAL